MNKEPFTVEGWLPEGDEFRHVLVSVIDGHIDAIEDSSGRTEGRQEPILLPGFIDIHCHGAAGIDVNSADAERLLEVGRFLAKHGVTGWLPTLVPDSQAAYSRVIDAIDEAMERQSEIPSAKILGVHYEGVFASQHMCGALHTEHFREFTGIDQLDSLPLPQSGKKLMTFAPEIEGGIALARVLTVNGWVASIGHTKATPDVLDAAFEAGAKHLTHFFNAMTGIHHRELGVAGWGLTKEGVSFDIIADGIHVHPDMMGLAVGLKGAENVSLISDSIAPTGLGDGEYEVWGENIAVNHGRTSNRHGSIAGSVISMDDAARRMLGIGCSIADISHMASLNPARLLGLEELIGEIAVGSRADILVCDGKLDVKQVFLRGHSV